MTYKPEYSKGEILVAFKGRYDDNFARSFGERIGYKLSNEEYNHGHYHIFETTPGEEEKAIKAFEKHKDFVEAATLRDLKWESVISQLRDLEEMIRDFGYEYPMPDKIFNKELDNFIAYLNNLKKK